MQTNEFGLIQLKNIYILLSFLCYLTKHLSAQNRDKQDIYCAVDR